MRVTNHLLTGMILQVTPFIAVHFQGFLNHRHVCQALCEIALEENFKVNTSTGGFTYLFLAGSEKHFFFSGLFCWAVLIVMSK